MEGEAEPYTVYIDGLGRWVRFVDREDELRRLHNLLERGYPLPLVVYGPEGCGKTALLRRFIAYASKLESVFAAYIDALEASDTRRALEGTLDGLWDLVEEVASALPGGGWACMACYEAGPAYRGARKP